MPDGQAEAVSRAWPAMMRVLHREKGAMLRIGILGEPDVQAFIDAHADALDASMATAQLSPRMRERLSQSNYVFSGIKTFHELNEAFPSLVDAGGERKPFERFLNDVRKVDETYNRNYLRAEYNFVAASSLMAARWEQFVDDGDDYNLQYRTAADDLVRPEHAALHGVTLPPSDPFWQVYYPPNGWNCRCTVVQVRKDKYPATDRDDAIRRGEQALSGDKKGMFRFNPGIQAKSVPDYNPYTISRCRDCDIASKLASGIFESDLCQACQLVRQCMAGKTRASEQQRIERNRKEYDRLSHDKRYKDVQFSSQTGGLMATHIGHNSAPSATVGTNGWTLEVKLVSKLYDCGHSVILCDEQKKDRQGNTLTALDMCLDGVRMDIKSIMKNKDFYGAAISHKNEQLLRFNARADTHTPADTICLYFDDPTMFSNDKITKGYVYMKSKSTNIAIKHILCALNTAKGLELKYFDF